MNNNSVWYWLVYAVVGLFALAYLPDRSRSYAVAALLLGGAVYMSKHGGSLDDLIKTIEGT